MATQTPKNRKMGAASPFSAGAKNQGDINNLDTGAGNIDKSKGEYPVKTSGVKIRGTGAATKGVMARGPLA